MIGALPTQKRVVPGNVETHPGFWRLAEAWDVFLGSGKPKKQRDVLFLQKPSDIMEFKKLLFPALLFIFVWSGCKDNDEQPADPDFLSCTIDGQAFQSEEVTCFPLAGKTYILAEDALGEKSVRLLLPEIPSTGTHAVQENGAYTALYHFSPTLSMAADSGSIEITNLDQALGLIEGRFSFRAKSPGSGIFFLSHLTDGSFRVRH